MSISNKSPGGRHRNGICMMNKKLDKPNWQNVDGKPFFLDIVHNPQNETELFKVFCCLTRALYLSANLKHMRYSIPHFMK